MKITAKDGTEGFNTIEECLKYEAELDAAERAKRVKEEELKNAEKARTDEIRKLYADLMERVASFEKDYNKMVQIPSHGFSYTCRF